MTFASALTDDSDLEAVAVAGLTSDPFNRVVAGGWGTGLIGVWTFPEGAGTHQQYFSVDGDYGVVNQNAPLAAGDLMVAVANAFGSGDREMLLTFAVTLGGSTFVDNVFYFADAPDLGGDWAGVEVYNSGANTNWKLDFGATFDPGATYVSGAFTFTPGVPVKLRFRMSATGDLYARIWNATNAEPSTWTAEWSGVDTFAWSPTYLVIQPRQSTTGNMVFRLDDVSVTGGVGSPGVDPDAYAVYGTAWAS